MGNVICYDIPEIVTVRKYEVDIAALQNCLKEHKNMTIKKIAEKLNLPKTQVEHWFRVDDYFCIPEANIWENLKELLEIKTNTFDKSIMTFENKPSVHEHTNRVYDANGIAPTIMNTNADIRIINF